MLKDDYSEIRSLSRVRGRGRCHCEAAEPTKAIPLDGFAKARNDDRF